MSGDHDDYQSEPIRGLPERPPAGEAILWQGAPSTWELAKDVFHIRLVAVYFGGLMAWRAHTRLAATGDPHAAIATLVGLLPVAVFGLGLLGLLAVLLSRTTVYTITSQRVVIRAGVAITYALNIPFKQVGSATIRSGRGGFGNIALAVLGEDRLAYGTLWPHVRPWHLNRPQPMLRGIGDVDGVAALLRDAVRAAMPQSVMVTERFSGDTNPAAASPSQGAVLGVPGSWGVPT